MLEILDGFNHDTVAIKASGIVTGDDYDSRLLPAIEGRLKDHASIKLWYEFEDSFKGISVETLWDDAMLGFFHLTDFSRVVIITDSDWIRSMAKTLSYMIPCPVKVFDKQESHLAVEWIADN